MTTRASPRLESYTDLKAMWPVSIYDVCMYSAIQGVSGMHKRGAGFMQTILHIVKIAGSLRNLVGQNTPPYAK